MLYHVFICLIFNDLQFILNNLEKKTILIKSSRASIFNAPHVYPDFSNKKITTTTRKYFMFDQETIRKFSQLQDQLHLSQSQLIKKLVEDKHEALKINPL